MTKYKWLLIFLAILAGGLLAWWMYSPWQHHKIFMKVLSVPNRRVEKHSEGCRKYGLFPNR